MSRLLGVLRRTFGLVREHVGTDHFGNKYYCIPKQKTWTGRSVRARRMVVAVNPAEFEYVESSIPPAWDAWIRGRRKDPPSIEELLKNESYRERIKQKAKEIEEKDLALQANEYEEGLVAAPATTVARGHAAATTFGKSEISQDPTSTGNTFEPGSWIPSPKK